MADKNLSSPESAPAASKKRQSRLLRFTGWLFKGLCLLLIFILLAAGGAGYWLLQTRSGQAWLLAQANKMLNDGQPNGKLRFHFTELSGSLPFTINVGLEALDDKGVFLRAPQNNFEWNWRELPGCVHIEKLNVIDASLLRLPELPPSGEPKETSDHISFDDIRALIGQGAEFLAKPPSWMPVVKIDNVALVNASLPQSLLGTVDKPATGDKKYHDAEDRSNIDEKDFLPKSLTSKSTDSGEILRADIEISLSLDKEGAVINAAGRLANEVGKKVLMPDFDFEIANLDLKIRAASEKDVLRVNAGVKAVLDEPTLKIKDIPPDLPGQKTSLDLGFEAMATCPDYGPAESIRINLTGPDLDAGRVQARGEGRWQSGPGFVKGELDGPFAFNFKLDLANGPSEAKDLLAMLRSPLYIVIAASGEAQKPNLDLSLACADIEASGHAVKNLKLNLDGRELVLPLALKALEADETKLTLNLSASLDKHELACNTGLFYKPLPSKDGQAGSDFIAGLRNLDLLAAGLQGKGGITARMNSGQKPVLDGSITLKVADWEALSAFLPGKSLSGDARIDLNLAAATSGQNIKANIEVPSFVMAAGKEKIISLRGFDARIDLDDAFAKPGLDAKINLENANAAGMSFGAKVAATGPIAGPLVGKVESTGSITSKVIAKWEPGKAEIRTLDVRMAMPPLDDSKGKAVTLGVRSETPVQITYGDGGFAVGNVDLRIMPSGRLTAKGGLSSEKLDFAMRLAALTFSPWQALVPQLPEGSAELTANLKGVPTRPSGNFRFTLNGVKVPKVPLAPISMALVGAIEPAGGNKGFLKAKLELPHKTVQALGGKAANVDARLPLYFDNNGIPVPDMKGPLAAHVLWDGALGPLWNLVPVADMRLNGRISMNIEAAGSLDAPRVKGGINIDNGRYENVAVGVLLTAIKVALNLNNVGLPAKSGLPGAMKLSMSASDGRGGTFTIDGGGSLAGENLDIQAKINRLRPLRRRDVHVQLSGRASVTGSVSAPAIDGKIVVDKGEVLLDNIAMGGGSITTLPISTPVIEKKKVEEKEDGKKAHPAGQGKLNVRIDMPPRFSVEGRGLTSLWEAHLLVSGTPFDPAITGNVSCYKGNFDFLGKNFVLTRGTVTFAGGSLANPLLDIELTNETPDLTAHLYITGTVNKMKLDLTSDPSLPRDDILSKVLFGRSSNELSKLEALQLAGAVAQLAGFTGNGSGIFQMGKKALGLDVLRFGSSSADQGGKPGETTASGSTLEAGKYINDWIYMGVQQGMKPDSTAFVIELELTPHSNIELKTDQSNTWGGYKWKYNY